jgi:hypothetical protein
VDSPERTHLNGIRKIRRLHAITANFIDAPRPKAKKTRAAVGPTRAFFDFSG